MSSTERDRQANLERAGMNLFRLPARDVAYDCFSDVPHHVAVPEHARGPADADPDEIAAALAPLTGAASLAFATKGRSAEIALVEALELPASPVVLTHGLFTTTQAALARKTAKLEDLPLAADGAADVDLERLAARLVQGGVHVVYLEVATNAWFGWPVSEAHLAAVRELCDRHGALLLVDAARPLANAAALGATDLVATARRMLALAHAFTISCAKEMLVPYGSVVGSPDAALIGRATQIAFKYGTSMSPIDPPQHRADLRDGARHALAHPHLIHDRLARVRALGEHLKRAGVPIVEPIHAHAVYVPVEHAWLPPNDVPAMTALLDQLYVVSGVRSQISHTKRGPALRFALGLDRTWSDGDLATIARGVAEFRTRVAERPALRVADGQAAAHPFFRRLIRT